MKEKIMKEINSAIRFISDNKSLAMKMLAGLIILITLLVIASCFKGTKYGNSAGNINNLGLAVQDGKWIYYVEVDGNEPVGICKVKTNGKKTEKVAEGSMYCLNIVDNYIYCLEYNEDDTQYDLIKIKTNGKKKEILARDIDEGTITVVDKWVYYNKNDNLYRVKINGTDREKISGKNISYYQIDGKWIYYVYENENSQYIAKMKLNGEDSKRIAKIDEDSYVESLYVKGGKIYYITLNYDNNYDIDYYLYKMNKKGEKIEKVCRLDTNIQHINMKENVIYYTTTEDYDTYEIKSIKYNGTANTTIKEVEAVNNINIAENWIFFVSTNEDSDTIMKMVSIDGKKEKEL